LHQHRANVSTDITNGIIEELLMTEADSLPVHSFGKGH